MSTLVGSGSDLIGTIIYAAFFVLSTLAIIYFVYLTARLSRKATPVEQEKNKKTNHDNEYLESS